MSDLKERALEKMNEEMSKPHVGAEDYIHNWLVDQEDDELFECILKEGKSIKDALNYLISKARDESKGSRTAVMSDAQGFNLVVNYFKGKETKVTNVGTVSNVPKKTKVEPKKSEPKKEEQSLPKKKQTKNDTSQLMSIFDFGLDDVIEENDDQQDEYEEVEDDEEL